MLPDTSPLISYIPLWSDQNISFQSKPMFVQQTVLEARDNIFFWRDLKTSQDSKDVSLFLLPPPPPTRNICLNSKVMSHLSLQRGRQVDASTVHKSFKSPGLGFSPMEPHCMHIYPSGTYHIVSQELGRGKLTQDAALAT